MPAPSTIAFFVIFLAAHLIPRVENALRIAMAQLKNAFHFKIIAVWSAAFSSLLWWPRFGIDGLPMACDAEEKIHGKTAAAGRTLVGCPAGYLRLG
jgi:hypothetical protein